MPQPRLSLEKMKEAADALIAANGDLEAASAGLGINRETFRYRVRKAKEAAAQGRLGTDPVLFGFKISRVGVQLGPDGQKQREWIEQRPEHGEPFELPDGHVVKGISALLDAEGRVIQQWTKTRSDGLPLAELKEQLTTALADFRGISPAIKAPQSADRDLVSVYPAADWHMGLLAWHRETGENYDLNIARETISAAMARVIACTPSSKQAILLGLGDILHADGYRNATPQSGNQLDVDGRYPRVLESTARLLITATMLALKRHEKVLIRLIPGNHDPESAIALTLALSMYFENNKRVTVDDDPGLFWWWEWGQVFLGASHGHQAKMDELPLIMAARNPEAWGRTKYRLIFTGHIHRERVIEKPGVRVESVQSPAVPDAWSHGMGYGAGRSMKSITLHKTLGELARQTSNLV